MSDTWAPADVNMQDYWAEVIGGEYKPVKHGKHASTHPRTVKAVLDGVRGSEIADVIVGMIFWQTIARNREQMAWERVRELEAEIASLRRERDDALRAAWAVRDLATTPISDEDVARAIEEAMRVRPAIARKQADRISSLEEENRRMRDEIWTETQRRERFEEDVWCAHKWLDDRGIPRTDVGGEVFSLVGRMMRLAARAALSQEEDP